MGMLAHGSSVTINYAPYTSGAVAIGGLRSIGFPDESKDLVDVTDHDSGGDREFVPGLRDGGQVDLSWLVESTDVGQQAMWGNYGSPDNTTATFVITSVADPQVSGSSFTMTFSGFVISRSGELPHDDVAVQSMSIKVDGAVAHSLVSV